MNTRTDLFAVFAAAMLLALAGCSDVSGEQAAGVRKDAAITMAVQASFLGNAGVSGSSIRVDTWNGTVLLTGYTGSMQERAAAETLVKSLDGVRAVRNELAVRRQ